MQLFDINFKKACTLRYLSLFYSPEVLLRQESTSLDIIFIQYTAHSGCAVALKSASSLGTSVKFLVQKIINNIS